MMGRLKSAFIFLGLFYSISLVYGADALEDKIYEAISQGRFSALPLLIQEAIESGDMEAMTRAQERFKAQSNRQEISAMKSLFGNDLTKMPPFQLFGLCRANLEAKDYAEIINCKAEMQRRIVAGKQVYCMHPIEVDEEWCRERGMLMDWAESILWIDASTAFDFGHYKKAIEAYEERLRQRKLRKGNEQDPLETTSDSAFLALAHAFNGDNDGALPYLNEVEKSLRAADDACRAPGMQGPWWHNSPMMTGCTLVQFVQPQLAKVYLAMRRHEEALATIEQSLKVSKVFDTISPGIKRFKIHDQFIQAKALFNLKRFPEAKEIYEQLISSPQLESMGELYWYVLFDLGRIMLQEDRIDPAIDYLKRAVAAIEDIRATINTEADKIGFVGDKQEVYRVLIEALMKQKQTTEAFEYVERAKARALVDLLASKSEFGTPITLKKPAKILLNELSAAELATRIQNPQSNPEMRNERRTRSADIRERLTQEAPELASLVTVNAASAKEIQSLLPEGETLLVFYQRSDTLLAFIVTRDRLTGVKLDGEALNKEIQFYRTLLTTSRSKRYQVLAKRLYQRLITPLERHIETEKLIIVPHGTLHYLPITTLHSGQDFLIDRFSIRHLPSASVMRFLKGYAGPEKNDLLVLGNPQLNQPELELKFAEREAQEIAAAYPKTTLLLRTAATETAVKRKAANHKRIHFASHAFFEPEQPLNSGILLVGDKENDGNLTAGELYSLRMPSDIVTLSACETALGEVSAGDDVIGLNRGFLYAGASTIVSSLWKVDDEATRELMVEFYKQLEGHNKPDALRRAQLSVRKQYPHPYFWAAFQITGNRH